MRFLFALYCCFSSPLHAQNIPKYDLDIALNCSKDRYIVIQNSKIFLPKGTQFIIARWDSWSAGMYDGSWEIKQLNAQQESYQLAADYFLSKRWNAWDSLQGDSVPNYEPLYEQDSATCSRSPDVPCGKMWFRDSVPFEAGNYYQFLIAYYPFTDTIIVPGDPLFGDMVLAISKIGTPFYLKHYTPPKPGFGCVFDASQYGTFMDSASGEMLQFSNKLHTVLYKSKKQPTWKNLYTYDVHPQCLRVSFYADHQDGGYYLWYSGKDWVLAGYDDHAIEGLEVKPQFFKRVTK